MSWKYQRLPWGKHRGKLLRDVPASYLCWIVEESDAEYSLRAAALHAIADRFAFTAQPAPSSSCRCVELEARWPAIYRRLALSVHPDRGGTTEGMQAVHELDDLVRKSA